MIKVRKNMVGLPVLSKMFDIDIKAVRRMVERGNLPGEQLDGRVFIDMDAVKAAATAEDISVSGYIKQEADRSCRNMRGGRL